MYEFSKYHDESCLIRDTYSHNLINEAPEGARCCVPDELGVAYGEEEEKRRNAFLRRVPPEPVEGAAGSTKLGVHLGEKAFWRRFDHDCTLEDVLNFVRSLPMCPLVSDANELRLADVTTRPARTFDVANQLGLTLKHLGLWPSGQLRCRLDGPDEAFDSALLGIVRLPSEDRA